MNDFRNTYRSVEKEAYWTGWRLLVMGIVGAFGLFVATWVLAPTKVLNVDKAIENYEWFHNANNDFGARVNQLRSHRKLLNDAPTDQAELARLRIEVAGIQAACRNLAASYNGRAAQVHRSIFQGKTAPEKLDQTQCD